MKSLVCAITLASRIQHVWSCSFQCFIFCSISPFISHILEIHFAFIFENCGLIVTQECLKAWLLTRRFTLGSTQSYSQAYVHSHTNIFLICKDAKVCFQIKETSVEFILIFFFFFFNKGYKTLHLKVDILNWRLRLCI